MEFEIQILNLIQLMRNPVLDLLMPVITRLGSGGIIWIIMSIMILTQSKDKKKAYVILISLLISYILCNLVLKNLIGRIRPYDVNTTIHLLINKPNDYSFPSGHTCTSFAVVSALYFYKDHHLWKYALLLAILISFSRLYLYVHYPTDILGGILLGILCGYIGEKAFNKLYNSTYEK